MQRNDSWNERGTMPADSIVQLWHCGANDGDGSAVRDATAVYVCAGGDWTARDAAAD
jgi:hypothetical protein